MAPGRLGSSARAARALLAALAAGLLIVGARAGTSPSAEQRLLAIEVAGRADPARGADDLKHLLDEGTLPADLRLEALALRGWLLADLSDVAGAEAVARQLEGADPSGGPAAAAWVRARAAEQSGDMQRANPAIDEAIAKLPASSPPRVRWRLLAAKAHIRNSAGRLEEAIRTGHEALKLADGSAADPWRRAESRNELAWSYYQARQIEPAWQLNQEAMDIARAAGDPLTLAHGNTVQGILEDARGNLPGERAALQAALDHARSAGAKIEESLYLANLADFYLKQGDYPTALRYASLALPLTRELKNLNGQTVALANIGLAKIALRDLDAGKRHLRESIAIDERRGSIAGVSETYKEMGQYLERAGDAPGAIEALHQHRLLADQLLQQGRQRSIIEMQEQFASERRARELELLKSSNRLQGEELRRRELEQRLTALLAGSGALALGAVGIGLRRVGRTNAQLEHSNARLEHQAGIDPLTGLANRRHLLDEMHRRGAERRFDGTVLLVDLDHFKRINDEHGHAAGDAVLVETADRLRATLRDGDLIVRWGGEEFLVVIRALGDDPAQQLAQRMLDAVAARPVVHEGRPVWVTASIGWATFPIEPALLPLSWERAIGLVDSALYLAKAHGRNRAYGVRRAYLSDAAQFEAVGRALEDAWMAGEVALAPQEGPRPADRPLELEPA